jgi:predicted permease
LSALLALFLNNLLPIFLASGAGFLLGKWLKVDPRSLSRVVFYIFSPCLVFNLLTQSQLSNGDILRMVSFATTLLLLVGGLALILGLLLRLERRMLIAVVLTAVFMNAGNYGLSVNLFAFGESALSQASLYYVTMGSLSYTIGVILASMGTYPLSKALLGLLKLPFVYALLLALVFVRMNWALPLPLERTTSLLGDAAIPAMLILLGLQLERARWGGQTLALALSNSLRLAISPLLAILISGWFGLQGVARQAGILEAAMPTAVMTTVLATEFDLEPSFVTTAVFTTTLLSPLTLTPLLAYLGA